MDIPNFPFTAICGQASLKLALKLTAIDPAIGGVLLTGPRGVAKSTIARGFFDILPKVSDNSLFVHLPLGSSEEMLTGTLDLEGLLQDSRVEFKEGLLARAHRGVLYVDEVNLLGDNLVDLLLDVATSGVNRIERDGVSHSHPSRFILMGTMNPEEGELRPQLLDRFGLMVEVETPNSVQDRVEIVERRLAFDQDAAGFLREYAQQQQTLTESLKRATEALSSVTLTRDMRECISQACLDAAVEGLRADIVLTRAATAHAALRGDDCVTEDDIGSVESLVLSHRRQSTAPPPKGQSTPPLNDQDQSPSPPSHGFRRPEASQRSDTGKQDQAQGDFGEMAAPSIIPMSDRVIEAPTKKKNGQDPG